MVNPQDIPGLIDHTLLKPTTTAVDIERLCAEAQEYRFASVCVNGTHVSLASRLLMDSGVKVAAVVGFPLGAMSAAAKAFEAETAISHGATEIDMVLSIGALKANDLRALHHDITSVVLVCHTHEHVLCKVILETSMLTDEEKTVACQVAKEARGDFVKTSTGFGGGGATIEDVRLMRGVVGEEVGVKASGGVRTLADAIAMVAAGANRLGTSAGVAIAREILGEATATSGESY